MTSLVTIDNVAKQFGERLLEKEASFIFHAGDRIGINASGKSTPSRLVAGETGFEDGSLNI